jgi:hypothetical protein
MRIDRIAFCAIFGCTTCVRGQDFVGTWLWSVTTDNGDALVEPGETASVLLSIDFDPDVFEKGLTGELVTGLGMARFDTLGGVNAAKGTILGWQVENNLGEKTGDQTTSDGVSLFGTNAQQGLGELFVWDDPIDVLSFEWSTEEFGQYSVNYSTSMLEPLLVWEGHFGDEFGELVEWDHVEAEVVFQVVPAPASALPIAGLVLAMTRRRR